MSMDAMTSFAGASPRSGKSAQCRLGIIGAGDAGARHLNAALRSGAHVAWVSDSDLGRASNLVADAGSPFALAVAAPLFDSVDAVCICTPPSTHRDLASVALQAGCHVLVEKPLACSAGDVDWFVKQARTRSQSIGVVSQHRYAGASIQARRLIHDGAVGDIEQVHVRVRRRRAQHYYADSWKGKRRYAGGGVLISLGYHTLDLVLSWLGRARVARARQVVPHGSEVETELSGELELEASDALVRLDVRAGDYETEPDTIEIVGSLGGFSWRGDTLVVDGRSGERAQHLHQHQLCDFVECLRAKREYPVGPASVQPTMNAIAALYASASGGGEVRVVS